MLLPVALVCTPSAPAQPEPSAAANAAVGMVAALQLADAHSTFAGLAREDFDAVEANPLMGWCVRRGPGCLWPIKAGAGAGLAALLSRAPTDLGSAAAAERA